MSEIDDLVKQAVEAYRAGRKQEAHVLLLEVVDRDEHHEQAWLWLSALVDTLEEQQICLENVLAINPQNENALKGLETISRKIADQQKDSPPQAEPPATPARPFGTSSSAPIGAEFASASGDSLVDDGQDTASDNWLLNGLNESTPEPDPFAPATSVDWGRSDTPAAYGSGKQIEQPSPDYYDEWVESLNINGVAPSDDLPDASPATDLFGSRSQPDQGTANDPFVGDPFADSEQPADEFSTESLFGSSQAAFDDTLSPFSDMPDDQLSGGTTKGSSAFGSTFVFDDSAPPPEVTFDEDIEDIEAEWAAELDDVPSTPSPSAPVFATRQKAPAVRTEDYFRYIPDDIEVAARGFERRSLVMLGGIIVLAILNLISFGVLLSSL